MAAHVPQHLLDLVPLQVSDHVPCPAGAGAVSSRRLPQPAGPAIQAGPAPRARRLSC